MWQEVARSLLCAPCKLLALSRWRMTNCNYSLTQASSLRAHFTGTLAASRLIRSCSPACHTPPFVHVGCNPPSLPRSLSEARRGDKDGKCAVSRGYLAELRTISFTCSTAGPRNATVTMRRGVGPWAPVAEAARARRHGDPPAGHSRADG